MEYRSVAEIPLESRRFIADFHEEGAEQILGEMLAPHSASWALVVDGEIRALASAQLRHVTPQSPEYTYMPPAYGLIGLSGWFVAPADWPLMSGLLRQIEADAAREGIDRLSIEIPVDHSEGVALALADGFEPDVILAGQGARHGAPQIPVGVRIRWATWADEDALVRLTLEEADYHAEHTNSGILGNQDPQPSREFVRTWLTDQHELGLPTFVAEKAGQVVGMLPLVRIDDGGGGPVPARYAYIGSTCVTQDARGLGIGGALVESAMAAAHDLGLGAVLVHYIADNLLAAPLWEGRGFQPLTVTFAKVGLTKSYGNQR